MPVALQDLKTFIFRNAESRLPIEDARNELNCNAAAVRHKLGKRTAAAAAAAAAALISIASSLAQAVAELLLEEILLRGTLVNRIK